MPNDLLIALSASVNGKLRVMRNDLSKNIYIYKDLNIFKPKRTSFSKMNIFLVPIIKYVYKP